MSGEQIDSIYLMLELSGLLFLRNIEKVYEVETEIKEEE